MVLGLSACEKEEIAVYYPPVVECNCGDVVFFEALYQADTFLFYRALVRYIDETNPTVSHRAQVFMLEDSISGYVCLRDLNYVDQYYEVYEPGHYEDMCF